MGDGVLGELELGEPGVQLRPAGRRGGRLGRGRAQQRVRLGNPARDPERGGEVELELPRSRARESAGAAEQVDRGGGVEPRQRPTACSCKMTGRALCERARPRAAVPELPLVAVGLLEVIAEQLVEVGQPGAVLARASRRTARAAPPGST